MEGWPAGSPNWICHFGGSGMEYSQNFVCLLLYLHIFFFLQFFHNIWTDLKSRFCKVHEFMCVCRALGLMTCGHGDSTGTTSCTRLLNTNTRRDWKLWTKTCLKYTLISLSSQYAPFHFSNVSLTLCVCSLFSLSFLLYFLRGLLSFSLPLTHTVNSVSPHFELLTLTCHCVFPLVNSQSWPWPLLFCLLYYQFLQTFYWLVWIKE